MQTNPITCNTERNYFFPAKESTSENEKYANDIEASVTRFVRKLGVRPNLTGYRLLIDAMIFAVKEPSRSFCTVLSDSDNFRREPASEGMLEPVVE